MKTTDSFQTITHSDLHAVTGGVRPDDGGNSTEAGSLGGALGAAAGKIAELLGSAGGEARRSGTRNQAV